MTWLGLDIGTTSVKGVAVDTPRRVLARARVKHDAALASSESPSWDEQDPERWLAATKVVIGELRRALAADARISGIGIVGQTPTLVAAGADGACVRPAMTWRDTRATREAAELAGLLGDPVAYVGTTLPWSASNLPAKLSWLRRAEFPSRAADVRVLQPKDYVVLQITGRATTDAWSSKGLVNVLTGRPSLQVLAAAGWNADIVPDVDAPWTPAGVVGKNAGDAFGLPAGCPVAVGWSDACAAMLALGTFARPTGFVISGTSDIAGASVMRPPATFSGLLHLPVECAPRDVVYGPTASGGDALAWAARLLDVDYRGLLELASAARTSPTVAPYVAGERAPLWRDDVRAAALGMDVRHGRPEFALGILTGVCLTVRHVLETSGARFDAVHIAASGTLGGLEERLRLRTLGVPLVVHAETHLSAFGAAMLGGVAAGEQPLGDAVAGAAVARIVEPTAADREAANHAWAAFQTASSFAVDWADAGAKRAA